MLSREKKAKMKSIFYTVTVKFTGDIVYGWIAVDVGFKKGRSLLLRTTVKV